MKSFIAALRNLVLPFGATTGARIVLNGVEGRIQVYDSSNTLVGLIDATGIWRYNSDGSSVRFGPGVTPDLQPTPQIIFQLAGYVPPPAALSELEPGAIYAFHTADVREQLLFEGPHYNLTGGAASNTYPQLYLSSPRYDGTATSEIYMNAADSSGNLLVTVEGRLDVTKDVNILGALAVLGNITGLASVKLDSGFGSRDIGRGYFASDRRTTTSGAVGAPEAVAWTVTSRTYKANRAYQVHPSLGVTAQTANAYANIRMRKANVAGQQLVEFYRTPCPVINTSYAAGQTFTFVVGGSDVTTSLVVTLEMSTGTGQLFGAASSSGSVIKYFDVGAAADFIADDANIAVLV